MKLSDKTITELVKGAVSAAHTDGMLGFYRFTKEISKKYAQRSLAFEVRSYASSGVRLDFISDTTYLKLGYLLRPGSSQELGAFDVFVDGRLWASEGENLIDGVAREIEIEFCEGKKNITVYFPCLAETLITSVEISDGASVDPAPEKPVAIFIGDSITQGYTSSLPSLCYAARLAAKMGVDFYNFGIGGDVFNTTVTEVEVPVSPAFVFTAFGTNDWSSGMSAGALKKNMREYYTAITKKFPCARIISILPIWRADNDKEVTISSFDALYNIMKETLSEFPRVEIIDGQELVPHVIPLYADLRLHPNETGFEFYANALFEKMSK